MKIFSGIRPSGELHIGNYLGAIKQWVSLQEKNECFFCIVDLHALTTPFEPQELKKNVLESAIVFLAAGIDPEKSNIFIQSEIKEHSELAWILGCLTPLGDLRRMTQFKEKSKKDSKNVRAGLLNYPLLMAADILLYQTDAVPVGFDQKQHVELTREIARRFNKKFGVTFKEPKILLQKVGGKIMSLKNPNKKMSKTDDPEGQIGLFEEPEEIKKKIMSAVTDPGKVIKYDPKRKPGISNLLTIYSLFSEKPIRELEVDFRNAGYEKFKKSLSELLIKTLEPFRKKRKEFLQRDVYLKEILKKGRKKAQFIAQSTIFEVKKKLGLI